MATPLLPSNARLRTDPAELPGPVSAVMPSTLLMVPGAANAALRTPDGAAEPRPEEALLKAGALRKAILNSANFSIIATDEKGIIQLFNLGAERMLGYAAAEVINKIKPSDMHDPQEVTARARSLSLELATTI